MMRQKRKSNQIYIEMNKKKESDKGQINLILRVQVSEGIQEVKNRYKQRNQINKQRQQQEIATNKTQQQRIQNNSIVQIQKMGEKGKGERQQRKEVVEIEVLDSEDEEEEKCVLLVDEGKYSYNGSNEGKKGQSGSERKSKNNNNKNNKTNININKNDHSHKALNKYPIVDSTQTSHESQQIVIAKTEKKRMKQDKKKLKSNKSNKSYSQYHQHNQHKGNNKIHHNHKHNHKHNHTKNIIKDNPQPSSQDSDNDNSNSSYSIPPSSLLYRHQNILFNYDTPSNNIHPARLLPQHFHPQPLNKNSQPIQSDHKTSRIFRSKQQKIYLLTVTRNPIHDWSFQILGTQQIPYHVEINQAKLLPGTKQQELVHILTCTCIDFQRNFRPCKHIYFVITQIAKQESILKNMSENIQINNKNFIKLDKALEKRLGRRMNQDKQSPDQIKQIQLKQELECAICFIQMDSKSEKLEKCDTCNKHFHKICLSEWKKHKDNCPLCRSDLNSNNIVREPGALQKLSMINIYEGQQVD